MGALTLLALAATAIVPSEAAMAAWWTGIGPQVILQNETTGQIQYSICNSNGQPFYSYTGGSAFSLSYKPKIGTALAGTGYWDSTKTVASIFYTDTDNNIINGLFNCNMTTGLFQSVGSWIISGQAPSISTGTGLAALLLGSTAGYRVYFHDQDMAVNELAYTQATNWVYTGVISQDTQYSPAIHAAFSGTNNISVVTPRDAHDIEVTRWNSDNSWHITTLPRPLAGNLTTNGTAATAISLNNTAATNFSLTAWTGKPGGLGISIDQANTRFLWYIGNDSSLYSVANKNYVWSPQANQSNAFWPLADTPNAPLAVASDLKSSMVRIYYMVKGQIAEVKFENNVWQAWATVPAANNTDTSPIPSSTPDAGGSSSTPSADSSSSNTGLSTGAKAGVGVGVSLGVIALGLLGAGIFLFRRRQHRNGGDEYGTEGSVTLAGGAPTPSPSVPPYGTSPPPPHPASAGHDNYMWEKGNKGMPPLAAAGPNDGQIHQLDSANNPTELYVPRPVYEMPGQTISHELVGDGH
ncbi:hypothetical protein QBC46DRAFT_45021 [Diplogelasinospora grovesii]|uniref:Fucose-specific lectin n=1 Tax=Diplogelasinospora grovesii TaxID=303347 RepID=A0AAN6MY62_9PEZI|nr:hypothetical protein QBC46DRAFT_45021 [Diplogelasinospora grovesii]